jgi:aminoglycoside phosphotransferase (APT) family kinase protein
MPTLPLVRLGGATGDSWACGEFVVRIGLVSTLRREVVAMAAAVRAVPVPAVLGMVEVDEAGQRGALVLSRLPGGPAGELGELSSERARRRGTACGRLHAALELVDPPPDLDQVAGAAGTGPTRLLHLDLHPFNVLVDEDANVTGVVDWANAAVGPSVLDRARTWSILSLDPAVIGRRADPAVHALLDGWSSTANFAELTAEARGWACEVMLHDLASRYPGQQLDHIRGYLHRLQQPRD